MAAYSIISAGFVRRTADQAITPTDALNTDYQAYLAWVAGGGTPDAAPAATPAPITPGQFLSRFTPTERTATQAACDADPTLGVGVTTAVMLGYVDPTDAGVIGWMSALVTAGALTAPRMAAILAGP